MKGKFYNENKIISIIPARGGSKGIKNKNIIPFVNKPLIQWTIQQSLLSSLVDETFVTTNNPEISKIAVESGAKVIPRPNSISKDESPTEQAISHAVGYLQNQCNIDPKVLVLLQLTSPLRKEADIDNAIREFQKKIRFIVFCSKNCRPNTVGER